MKIFCKSCGHEIWEGDKFCEWCGNPINWEEMDVQMMKKEMESSTHNEELTVEREDKDVSPAPTESQQISMGNPYVEEIKTSDMSVGNWILTYLILCIPLVNLVMLIIWAVGKPGKYPSRKTWAIAQWVIAAIGILIGMIVLFVGGASIASIMGSMSS